MRKCTGNLAKSALVSLFLLSVATNHGDARALQNMRGSDLYRFCTAKAQDAIGPAGNLLCLGYLSAITDIFSGSITIASHRACLPDGADEQQIVDVSTEYIRNHPETRHLPAYRLVSEALAVAFPCR